MEDGKIAMLIVFAIIGILLAIVGIIIWKKQAIKLIHDYHYKNVKEENRPAYTKAIGIGSIIIGGGLLLSSILMYPFGIPLGLLIAGISFIIGIGYMWYIQRKYNGGMF